MNLFQKIIASSRVRMLIVGALSLILAYATFLVLIELGVHYQFASVSNFIVYWVVNFTLNRVWAFKSSGNVKKEARAHMSLHLGNQILIMAGLYTLVEVSGISPQWSQLIMQVIATLTVFALTPLIFKHKS